MIADIDCDVRWDGTEWIYDRAFKELASNQSRVSTVTPTDVAGFNVDLCTGLWNVEATIAASSSSTTPNIAIGWRIASGTAALKKRWIQGPALTRTGYEGDDRSGVPADLNYVYYGIATHWPSRIKDQLLLNVTAPITLHIQAAQQTSNAAASVVEAGSYIEARRVG